MDYLLGVDLGTSGTKTVLFDTEGREVASQTVEYPLYQPRNGWAEQDPEDWWNAAAATIRGVLEKSGLTRRRQGPGHQRADARAGADRRARAIPWGAR